ncbi:MAG: transglycosylase domain-containing protein, partial [Pseudomonadales bacterium]|nr:transglycosylase domain-containing protein [Pseudomonadales bacterium]
KEMLLALKIEQELSKEEILELYINVVPFGKRAYGLQAAAYTYYGKSAQQLNLPQLAMLAGIPKRPEAGNPINGPTWALQRRNLVLRRMLQNRVINERQYTAAVVAPITAKVHHRDVDLDAPYPAEWIRRDLIERYGRDIYSGFVVYTTIDAAQQATAQTAVRTHLQAYDRRHGYRGPYGRVRISANEQSLDPYLKSFETRRPIGELEPAVVVSTSDDGVQVLRANGDTVVISREGYRWARPYIDTDSRGRTPRSAGEILDPGDLIHITAKDEQWHLAQIPNIQGALVALNPRSGAVTAMVGGFDFSRNQYNHAVQAARQPGSSFKPFVYSAALDHGVTPASVYLDAPLVFEDKNLEQLYRPRNDSGEYNGPTRLREALYRSINLVSMRVLLEVGAGKVMRYVSRFGFETDTFPRNTQLAIGGGTMALTPLEMASGYAIFANGGYKITPHIVKRIEALDGSVIFEPKHPIVCRACKSNTDPTPHSATRVVDERNVFIINSMLRDVIKRGTGRGALQLQRADLSGKTGTTNEAADTWFNGFHADLVTSVWVGFSNHRPIGSTEYGSTTPLPIWIDFMREALKNTPETSFAQPAGVVSAKIDPRTGRLAPPDQEDAIFEYFFNEDTPTSDARPQSNSTPSVLRPEDVF